MIFRKRHHSPYIPGFSQGAPEPKHLKRYTYGALNTIHQTGTIDVQLDKNGQVVAVWFRCLNLPFHVSVVQDLCSPIQPDTAIESITYVEREET